MPSEDIFDLYFQGIPCPVRFIRCSALLPDIRAFFHAWPYQKTFLPQEQPIIILRRTPSGRYLLDAPWLPEPLYEDTATCALCTLSVDMVTAFCKANPNILCMHAAAIQFRHGSILLLGDNGSGKSLLTARLMASGHIGYGDDMVGLMPDNAIMSFGLPLRLRRPLPPSEALGAFVQKYKGIGDTRYQYLKSDMPLLASFGQQTRLTHGIVLQRSPGAAETLISVDHAGGMRRILPRYVMHHGMANTVFKHAMTLISQAPILIFRYSDLDSGAEFLCRKLEQTPVPFSTEQEYFPAPPKHLPMPPCRARQNSPGSNRISGKISRSPFLHIYREKSRIRHIRHIQTQGVHSFPEKTGLFLIHASTDAIFHLNPLGQAVWKLLEAPLSETEAILLLKEAFQTIPQPRIQKDIAELFRALRKRGLIQPVMRKNRQNGTIK